MTTRSAADVALGPPPLPPKLDPASIARLAARSHGLEANAVRLLGGEWASNARLTLEDGTSRMFKAVEASNQVHADHLEALFAWRGSLALSASQSGLPAATPLQARTGGHVAALRVGDRYLLVMISPWMPGVLLASADMSAGSFVRARESLGATAAGMVKALQDHNNCFGSDAHHPWAFEGMVSTITTALAVPSTRARMHGDDARAVLGLLARFAAVSPTLEGLPRGLTHHDLNDFNVLVDPRSGEVTGIVDFDDACVAPLVSETAIAGAYAMLGADDPIQALIEVVGGAVTVRPFNLDEARVILAGAAVRLCLNAVLWTERSTSSNAAYGAARMARTWPVIRLLATLDWGATQAAIVAAAIHRR